MESRDNSKLANLIIAGVNKAGSTSLFHYLSAHPDVCGSKDKETCYFLPLLYNEEIAPLKEYEAQFENCAGKTYRLEATPAYIFGGEKIARNIHNTLGEVKIIIILKDPVERMVSFYQRKKATFQLPQDLNFREYVKLCLSKTPEELDLRQNQVYTGISLGLYHQFMEPWLEIFGANIKVVFFDDLKKNTGTFMEHLASWLKIDSEFYENFEFDIKNKSLNYKNRILHRVAVSTNNTGKRFWRSNPDLKKKVLGIYYKFNGSAFAKHDVDAESLHQLREYYKPHNQKLHILLNAYGIDNLPVWIESSKVTA